MKNDLTGKKVAILVADGFEQVELEKPQKALEKAGADWVDEVVVCDQGLVTSRKPADIPKFNDKMIEEFAEGFHAAQRAGAEQAESKG